MSVDTISDTGIIAIREDLGSRLRATSDENGGKIAIHLQDTIDETVWMKRLLQKSRSI